MSDVRQIIITREGGESFSCTHEAGIEVVHDTMGVMNETGRSDGAGDIITEQKLVNTKCVLPNIVNNRQLKTYEKFKSWLRSGEKATVTVAHWNGDVYKYLGAIPTAEIPLNVTKTTFPVTIEAGRNSGLQS